MINEEESWGEPEQNDPFAVSESPHEQAGDVPPTNEQEESLVVPKKEDKRIKGKGSTKKPVPKKQMYILGGIAAAVVIVAGGGLTYAHMMQEQQQSVSPMQQQAPTPPVQKPVAPVPYHPNNSGSMGVHGNGSGFSTLSNLPDNPAKVSEAPMSHTTAPLASSAAPNPVSSATAVAPNQSIRQSSVPENMPTLMTGDQSKNSAASLPPMSPSVAPQNAMVKHPIQDVPATPVSSGVNQSQIDQMKLKIEEQQEKVERLESELLKVKSASAEQPTKTVTRTIVKYVDVPVKVPARQPIMHDIPVHHHSDQAGWSVMGGNSHAAILSMPDGQVITVKSGDALPNGSIVEAIGNGVVQTNHGEIR